MKLTFIMALLLPTLTHASDLTKFYGIEVNGTESAFIAAMKGSGAEILETSDLGIITTPGKLNASSADSVKVKHCLKNAHPRNLPKKVRPAWQYACKVELGSNKDAFGLYAITFNGKLERLVFNPMSNATKVGEAIFKNWNLPKGDGIELEEQHMHLMQPPAAAICSTGGCKAILKDIGADTQGAFVYKAPTLVLEASFSSKLLGKALNEKIKQLSQ